MSGILMRAIAIFDDGGIDAVWSFLNRLIRSGEIEEGTAEQIAYMAANDR